MYITPGWSNVNHANELERLHENLITVSEEWQLLARIT